MADILLFHHAEGQTEGLLAFADELRAAGHVTARAEFFRCVGQAGYALRALPPTVQRLRALITLLPGAITRPA